ncbi:MAG: efflux RND transporter periplasmic adaptor subunit, partial [Clostridia bacterium]|nr:efflux RND transporter periplasmic adaptor subunit [Clostridia bacterium]
MPVQVISRVDGSVRPGSIYKINTEEPVKDEGRYYYPEDGGEKASKYAFYVELSSIEGLIMGQHVYIEP